MKRVLGMREDSESGRQNRNGEEDRKGRRVPRIGRVEKGERK